jgi:hypothetical protein
MMHGLKNFKIHSLFRKIRIGFGLKDYHQAIFTKIVKIRFNAIQIKLVISDRTWLTKFIRNYIKSLGW